MEAQQKLKNLMLRRIFTSLFILINLYAVSAENDSIPTNDSIPGISEMSNIDIVLPELPRDSLRPIGPTDPMVPVFPRDTTSLINRPSEQEPPKVNPLKPDIPVGSSRYSVGTSKGNLSVSRAGAAEYNLMIECPAGGSLIPQISLAYSSQNMSYGVAGYGIGLSGLSSITRGEKTLFNNSGSIAGVTYTASDNLYLDGKRMILLSGSPSQEGAEYCLEGDPYTKVTAHGTYTASLATTWFEVKTQEGKTYRYGESSDSRIEYMNKTGNPRIASWYVSREEDVYGNYVTYTYSIRNYYAYPRSIRYGFNSRKDRGIINKIDFEYEDIGCTPGFFNVEDRSGNIDRRISSIITSSNDSIYRKYRLEYYDLKKFAYLDKVYEENGKGESFDYTSLWWKYFSWGDVYEEQINATIYDDNPLVEEQGRQFFAADLNGDGFSDIVRLSQVKVIDYSYNGHKEFHQETRLYISRSKVSSAGGVSYLAPIFFTLSPSASMDGLVSTLGGPFLADFDGDGYNDILLGYYRQTGQYRNACFYIVKGCDVAVGGGAVQGFQIPLQVSTETPLFTAFDIDKNGKDEIICLEKAAVNGNYRCTIVNHKAGAQLGHQEIDLKFPAEPKKLFCGDYNNDGLSDIIILYNEGYKIYFNNGGTEDTCKFSEFNSKTGSEIGNHWRYQQGDFDGDGLLDFVYNVANESFLWIARNNGDGTFCCVKSDDIGVSDQMTLNDNSRFSIHVCDANRDGKSDVMFCKAIYKGYSPIYDHTQIKWLFSDGITLRSKRSNTTNCESDANENCIFSGDFDGDGFVEIANYGNDLLRSQYSSAKENQIHVYSDHSDTSIGRIYRIIDGMGNDNYIDYAYVTNPRVYTRTPATTNQYPVNTYSLPLPVVKKVSIDNGVAGTQEIEYSYHDLRIHMKGAGSLGFMAMTSANKTTGESTKTEITKWDEEKWIPIEMRITNTVGSSVSSTISTYTVENVNNTYFAYESNKTVTDVDGNVAVTISNYDKEKGVILDQTVKNDGGKMYKRVVYSGYQNKSNRWLPTVMSMTQKHEHDPSAYTNETRYTYDDKGNILATTVNYGTPLALKTTATYDIFGNRLSSCSVGKGVKTITKYNDYDPTGRFVVKSYYNPDAAVNIYTYDCWGNLLTESDITDPSNILTTTNTYDGWGRLVSTVMPDSTVTTSTMGWGVSRDKKYYILTSKSERPWVLTWYDEKGNEVSQQSFGPKNILRSKTKYYNEKGLVSKIESVDGLLTVTEKFNYDELGRILTDSLSSGKEISYTYGNRTVTTTVSGRTSMKTTDAWGNVVKSVDSSGGEVTYSYNSNGKPSRITTNGSTVVMTYDGAGNLISLNDPDAGIKTYEYAADGTPLMQTDARGVQTMNTYDALGRLSEVRIGENLIVNTYGTSGNGKLRLVKKSMGNNSIEFTYDRFGRVLTETRKVAGEGDYVFAYEYDSRNRPVKTTYPGGLEVITQYDDYGFKIQTSAAGNVIYRLKDYTGLKTETSFMDSLTYTRKCDVNGYEVSRVITNNKSMFKLPVVVLPKTSANGLIHNIADDKMILDQMTSGFDPITDNLTSRMRYMGEKETFGYDDLDRLVSVSIGDEEAMTIDYAPNGNITSKTGIGGYAYNDSFKPHAVISVDNLSGIIPSHRLITDFNDFGKVRRIEDEDNGYVMDFVYGPDLQRWRTVLLKDSVATRTVVYARNYEKVIENGVTREFYYLDGVTIVIKKDGEFTPYLALTDHLGSILSVFDKESTKVFSATYDAWGRQEVSVNTIGLIRGYTSHEMLNEFGIINMNGRLYDPVLGRFFSPDPYVQLPDYTQSYNRYSYCLNNPLKYTDPTGESITGLIAFGAFNLVSSMMNAAFNGENIWKAGALSLLSSAASYGIGQLFGMVGCVGKELLRAGVHAVSGGVFTALGGGSFGAGFASGAISSGIGSFVQGVGLHPALMVVSSAAIGGVAAWATGGDFLAGALNGLKIAMFNHLEHQYVGIRKGVNEDGDWLSDLPEVECVAFRRTTMFDVEKAFAVGSTINTGIDCFGRSLEKNSGNSTIGSNVRLYFHKDSERGFYGNQYVRTIKLTKIGGYVTKVTGPIGKIMDVYDLYDGAKTDYLAYKNGGSDGYNTARVAAGLAAGWGGAKTGILVGGEIGVCVGGPLGAIVGSTILGIIGAWSGDLIGTEIVDYLYQK